MDTHRWICVSGRDGVVRTRWGPCPVSCQVLFCGDKHIRSDANEGRCFSWMSTAFLDSAVEAPRFGYPGVVSLYAMQHTMDVEEEMCFDPAIHCFQGIWKHEDPLFFIHGLRQLMRLATERVARSYGYRVGGVLVDYGTLYRFLVEEAEAWECSEGRLEERRKTSPLDVFAGTIAETEIDHLFVLGSA
ncbi:mucin-associated surface protein (MASP), partial [Trypanosoma cruzi]